MTIRVFFCRRDFIIFLEHVGNDYVHAMVRNRDMPPEFGDGVVHVLGSSMTLAFECISGDGAARVPRIASTGEDRICGVTVVMYTNIQLGIRADVVLGWSRESQS